MQDEVKDHPRDGFGRWTGGSRRRQFTPEEDQRILANTRGEITLSKLMRELHVTRDLLTRRASELDVRLRVRTWKQQDRRRAYDVPVMVVVSAEELAEKEAMQERYTDPYRITNDTLLQRLFDLHGDRRYAQMKERDKG